ncbi:MAG TPA: hypothetical protein PKO06_18600, partial [Candidatus Ozemobacteraceae bacterium]|nr:hypothetical protein [Candidatus Ozemobacteraceae bacterium]
NLVVRDKDGGVVSINPSPIMEKQERFYRDDLSSHPLYISKLLYKLLFLKVAFPTYTEGYWSGAAGDLPVYSSFFVHQELEQRFRQHVDFFQANLRELIDCLRQEGLDSHRILFYCNPHLEMLQTPPLACWKSSIDQVVQSSVERENCQYLRPDESSFTEIRANPTRFYLRGDMHFSPQGLMKFAQSLYPELSHQLITHFQDNTNHDAVNQR